MPLSDADQKRLQVLVTPAAWAAYQALDPSAQLDLVVALEVYGDVRLVAADVLEAACLVAQRTAAITPGKKRIKVGQIEVEKAATGTTSAIDADAWCAVAARLRALATGSGVPGPAFTEWCP